MKKLIALLISAVIVLSISVPSFADNVISPEKPENYVVTCNGVQGAKDGTTSSVPKGDQITLTADKTKGTFDKWTIDGKYTIVSGGLDTDTITIKPDSDLTVTANFKINPDISYKVLCFGVDGITNGGYTVVNQGSYFTVTPDKKMGTFSKWAITGSYDIISGGLDKETLTLMPKSDLVISAAFTNGDKSEFDTNQNGKYDVQAVSAKPVNGYSASSGTWSSNKAVVAFDAKNNQLTVSPNPKFGTFNNWSVYLSVKGEDGKQTFVEAIEGVHYTIANGSLTSDILTVIPLADIVICGNYNGKTTSPKTADYSAYFALIAIISLAGIAVTSKKVFSK
jgi:hypothetical protein